eukprot:superscaffoldBa00001182_g9377
MEVVAARMAMVTDSPNPSLRSRTTVTTDGDSFVSTASLPCSHFLSANVINVGMLRGTVKRINQKRLLEKSPFEPSFVSVKLFFLHYEVEEETFNLLVSLDV